MDIAAEDPGKALYDNSPQGVACQEKYHRQLDELLKLNLTHLREDRILQDVKQYMATDFLAKSQLQNARHALEKAQMDYRHAKENVAMNCRFSSEQES